MAKSLVIVESPAKAKTIGKYLGKDFVVKASLGHVKDLPKKDLSVDVDKNFEPHYEVIEGKKKLMAELKSAAKGMDSVYLAADPDREGEAICFHLQEELNGSKKGPKFYRVMFNEITAGAIKKAFEKPGSVNLHLVDAQQARRILDRLVGYKISPLLWDKVRRGLSAGRVQTIALRLIVDREREIRAFIKREYWTIDVQLNAKKPPVLTARFTKKNDEAIELPDEATTKGLLEQLDGSKYLVHSVATREKKRNPVPPFITSTLQQEASRKLRFSVKRTMMIAQRLYEGVELGAEGSVGLITYMRTDSTRVSNDALDEVRGLIKDRFGPTFVPESPNVYKGKKDAQDAHEAVRPSSSRRTPDDVAQYLQEDELKLYRLIWMRFVASQMMPAVFDQTTIDVAAKGKDGANYMFRATGSVPKFNGFLDVYKEGKDEKDADDEEEKNKLPLVTAGRGAEVQGHRTGAALHRAAAALQRSDAGEGVGIGWRGAPVDLCVDSFDHSGARVRKEGGRQIHPHRARHGGDRPAAREFPESIRREVHGASGRRAGRNRRRQDRLARVHGRFLRPFPEGSGKGRADHDRHQADGEAHRLDLRQVRQAHGDQVGPARQLHRVHRVSGVLKHARADGGFAGCGQGGSDRAGRAGVLRKLRPSHGAEEGPLRAVLRVLRISGLQDDQADRRRAEEVGCAAG